MKSKIEKINNTHYLKVDDDILNKLNLCVGDEVEITINNKTIYDLFEDYEEIIDEESSEIIKW